MERPPTSKARGICRYYKDPRGCWAGSECKFLHCENPETDQGLNAKLTPYDQAKTCRYFAKGHCKRADKCWFLHVAPQSQESSPEGNALEEMYPEDELCSICFEKPALFGLLAGCSHVFCITCIKQWRDPAAKSGDVVFSGVHKKCPMCRTSSRFVTPSSLFFKQGDPRKEGIIAAYKESMARVPCWHFVRSKVNNGTPFCPFGKDCFYQHLNADGTKYTFTKGFTSMRHASQRLRHSELDLDSEVLFSDIFASFGESSLRNPFDLFSRILQDERLTHLTNTLQAVATRVREMVADVENPGESTEAEVPGPMQAQPSMQGVPTIAITDRSRPITSWTLDPPPNTIQSVNVGVREVVAPGDLQRRLLHSLDDFASGLLNDDEEHSTYSEAAYHDIDHFLDVEPHRLPRSLESAEDREDTSSDTSMPSLHLVDSSDDDDELWMDGGSEDETDARRGHLAASPSDGLEPLYPDDEASSRQHASMDSLYSSGGRRAVDETRTPERSDATLGDSTPSNIRDTNDTAHSTTGDGNSEDTDREEVVQPPFVTDGRGRVIGALEESSGSGRSFLSRMLDGLF